MQSQLDKFKEVVVRNCDNPSFVFREWFAKDHLLIVEKIAMELCDIYQNADREVVFALVYFHDFGKPIDENNEREMTRTKGVEAMREVGLPEDFIQKVLTYWERMEMKNEIDISKEMIEVQIISSADGASHFVGKFLPTYFGDEPKSDIKTIEERIKNKITTDWERKITLPEIKKAFQDRYLKALEITGEYPDKFI